MSRTTMNPPVIAVVLSFFVIVSFGLSAWSFSYARDQGCSSRAQVLGVLSSILVAAQTSPRSKPLTRAQQQVSDAFYNSAYKRIDTARCH